MSNVILTTKRMNLRRLESSDFDNLCLILKDEHAMYAYEHAFSDEEVYDWLVKQINRYWEDGFGLWAAEDKKTGEFLGQIGMTRQFTGEEYETEIGYLLVRKFWNKGYATEGAIACRDFAFKNLCKKKVVSIIRDNNIPSQNVALRIGMKPEKAIVKQYYNMDMAHTVYSVFNENL